MKEIILVLGASLKENRYSNRAVKSLVNKGFEVKAIGVMSGNISGIDVLTAPVNFEGITTVTLYLNPERQKDFYSYILDLKPKRVLFNPGTENIEFSKLLKTNGIEVQEVCTLVLLATNQF